MATGWTKDRKARQALAIHRWKPWRKATGPRSLEGKARSAMNGLKHGARSLETRALNDLLRQLAKRPSRGAG
jgi:hypothetical protein